MWLYNLHYFDYLNSSLPIVEGQRLIEQWIEDNPPVAGVGWEPYPISLRVVNWIKWAVSRGEFTERISGSIATQLGVLEQMLEYHLLGNHLWANGKALVFGGLCFTGSTANRWLEKGLKIISRELPEQILQDGGHFERSPTYHALILEDLLDLMNIFRIHRQEIPAEWQERAHAMLRWLVVMTRPDGRPPLFNDAAHGISPDLASLCAYARRLGLSIPSPKLRGMQFLPDTGYFRFSGDVYTFFGDVGVIGPDYIPGHAHADTFNFELFANDRPLIVDVGVSTYESGPRRLYERGTSAHNTVQLGDWDQSEVWGSFRVGRRAKVIDLQTADNAIAAAHTGYCHIGAIHRRKFSFNTRSIRITDQMKRDGCNLPAIARLHFAPGVAVEVKNDLVTAEVLRMKVAGAKKISLFQYEYAPEFNCRIPAIGVAITFDTHLECNLCL